MSLLLLSLLISSVIGGVPEPPEYILSFPTGPNPLNITVDPSPEKNYFILLGDWGCAASDTEGVKTQNGVAKLMKSFVSSQKSKGMNLLFIGTVGDNFYNAGQNCNDWARPWSNVYGELTTDYYWFSVWGNHDWGNNDPNAMCAWNNPKYIDPNTKIPYAADQLNANKGGCNPKTYWQPDFGYYYSIPELNFEYIATDENASPCTNNIISNNFKDCGGSQKVGCGYMQKIQDATMANMKERAKVSTNTNFMMVQHYAGGQMHSNNNAFKSIRGNSSDYRVWSAGGHTHQQLCMHNDTKNGVNVCDEIRTGGGGTGNVNNLHGFWVIGFDENKKMIQPFRFDDPLISCMPPCQEGAAYTEQERFESNFYYCCTDPDEADLCEGYDTSTCTTTL